MKGLLADPLVGRVTMSGVIAPVTALIVLVHDQGLHGIEVGPFGAVYFLCWQTGGLAGLVSPHPGVVAIEGCFDPLYFSAVVYTTGGFGDIVPQGPIRLPAGSEVVTGVVLITGSASFIFLEMQRYWREGPPQR